MEQQRPTGEEIAKVFCDFRRLYPAGCKFPYGGNTGALADTHQYLLNATGVYTKLTTAQLSADRAGLVLLDYELCKKFFAIRLRLRKQYVLELDSRLDQVLCRMLPKNSAKSAIKKL